jgi:hypothetical protein
MILETTSHQYHDKKGLLKRIGFVVGIFILAVTAIHLISYTTRPQIQYSLKEANCRIEAIAARNKTIGSNHKSCILIISAKNLEDESARIDYDGVGGGPTGGGEPLIRIYSSKGKFCYALLGGEGSSFSPGATNDLTLHCARVQKPPKNYDIASDTNPTAIVISGYSKSTIKVEPNR